MPEDILVAPIPTQQPRIKDDAQDDDERKSSLPVAPVKQEATSSLLREIAFIGIICMSQLMTQASLAQTIVPLHIIGHSFGTSDPGQLSWFPAAYSLTVGTFILIAGRLGDLFGHKLFFVVGFIWYGIWTLLAGFSVYSSSSPIFFDICRAFQGMGPAFLLPNSIALLGRRYENGRRKEMVFSIFGATAPGGFVLGAVFSGIFAEFVWWPWTFWVGGIVGLLCAVLGQFIIPTEPRPQLDTSASSGNTMLALTDALGAVTGVSGLVLINFAWNQAPIVGWSTPYIYVLLIVGFAFMFAFAYVESRAPFPLIPAEIMTKDTGFILGCITFGWATFGIWTYYVWLIEESLEGHSPLLVTARFSLVAISGLCAAITTGFMLHRLGPGVAMCIAMCAFCIGTTLIATMPLGQTYWAQLFVAILVTPWGMDMSFPAANIVLSDRMKPEHQGVAASLVNTVLNYSISLGLGFAGTIESHINPDGKNELKGYRSALYFGIGLSALGVLCSVGFIISNAQEERQARRLKALNSPNSGDSEDEKVREDSV